MTDPHELVFEYYDLLYPHDIFEKQTMAIREKIIQYFKNLPLNQKIRVIDFCTGTGRMLSLFKNHLQFELYGVEINEKMRQLAQAHYPDAKFFGNDIRSFNSEISMSQISALSITVWVPASVKKEIWSSE